MSTSRTTIGIIVAIIAVLVLGILLFASLFLPARTSMETTEVGDRVQDAGAQEERTHVEKVIDSISISLSTTSNRVQGGEAVPVTITVTNAGTEPRELPFASAQRFDIWVKDSAGREVWRWSEGKMFAQVLETVSLGPNEARSYTESWPSVDSKGNPVKPGEYRIFAHVVAGSLTSEVLDLPATVEEEK